ncbi:MAG: response regulator transcription factor [Thermodesulfobacteriota bacterium]
MTNKSKARILVVEDDPALLRGLLDFLVFNGFEALGAADGGEGRDRALDAGWDLIILDVMLPTLDGFSICREVRRHKPGQAVLMLTAKGSEDDVVTGFKAGADDYITKPFSLREFMVRVEALLRRAGKTLGEEQVTWRGLLFDGRRLKAVGPRQAIDLTRREMDLVVYLDRHRERIVTKKELLSQVWSYADPNVETRTVDIHMLKLRKKVQTLDPDAVFILTVRGEGYRLEPEEGSEQ